MPFRHRFKKWDFARPSPLIVRDPAHHSGFCMTTKSTKLSHIIHGKHALLPFLVLPRIRHDLPSAWNTWTANGENQRLLFDNASAWKAPTWFFTTTCCHFHSLTRFMRVLRFKFYSCNLNLVEWSFASKGRFQEPFHTSRLKEFQVSNAYICQLFDLRIFVVGGWLWMCVSG